MSEENYLSTLESTRQSAESVAEQAEAEFRAARRRAERERAERLKREAEEDQRREAARQEREQARIEAAKVEAAKLKNELRERYIAAGGDPDHFEEDYPALRQQVLARRLAEQERAVEETTRAILNDALPGYTEMSKEEL
jgi:hypothetical protein